jgi:hypothetical protein
MSEEGKVSGSLAELLTKCRATDKEALSILRTG